MGLGEEVTEFRQTDKPQGLLRGGLRRLFRLRQQEGLRGRGRRSVGLTAYRAVAAGLRLPAWKTAVGVLGGRVLVRARTLARSAGTECADPGGRCPHNCRDRRQEQEQKDSGGKEAMTPEFHSSFILMKPSGEGMRRLCVFHRLQIGRASCRERV